MNPVQRPESTPWGRNIERHWSCLIFFALLLFPLQAHGQDLNLNPSRPTIADSAATQSAGVLQVETGYDAYPTSNPGNMQTVDTFLSYAPLSRLRLDFTWSAFVHQQQAPETTSGIGPIQFGGKVVLYKEDYHRPAPGLAIQYEAGLPTASEEALQGYGQQAIFLINHHYGPNGDLDVILNGSIVQANCQTSTGCSYGGQQALTLSYHLQKDTRLYFETFAQNVSQSNTPPGTYVFGGFYHAFSDAFGIDAGLRFGVSSNSPAVGTTVGLVFGKRLHSGGGQKMPRS